MPLLYLPQHLGQAGLIAMGVAVALTALPALVWGRMRAAPTWPARRVRGLALVQLGGGALMVLVSFFLSFDRPGQRTDPWGTTGGRVGFALWLLILVLIVVHNLRRDWPRG